MISAEEREFVINQLDETRDALLRFLDGLSCEQLLYRPARERWSIAENVEHLVLVEGRLVGDKALQAPVDPSKCCAMSDADVMRVVAAVEKPLQSPPPFQPELRWPPETLTREFETVRRRSREFASGVKGDFRRRFFPHPFFGDFDCYQWLLVIPAHCQRHTAQSEAVKSSPNFPN